MTSCMGYNIIVLRYNVCMRNKFQRTLSEFSEYLLKFSIKNLLKNKDGYYQLTSHRKSFAGSFFFTTFLPEYYDSHPVPFDNNEAHGTIRTDCQLQS